MPVTLFISDNEIPVKIFKFPGGEMNVQIQEDRNVHPVGCYINADLRSADDIMTLLLLTDACRRKWGYDFRIHLVMPYVPYMQQDRVCSIGESLSVKVFTEMINAQNYYEVEIWDPHSDVTPALLNNCKIVPQEKLLAGVQAFLDLKKTVLVVPDAGAVKKGNQLVLKYEFFNRLTCSKVRSLLTGEIARVLINTTLEDWYLACWDQEEHIDCLIVDDICVGGKTFTELAKKLQGYYNGDLYLYVTHGVFSNGFDALKDHFKHIFTVNPWHIDNDGFVISIL